MKDFKKFGTSKTEIWHISIALFALAVAFSFILFSKEIFHSGTYFYYSPQFFFETLIAVGFAFVLHELGHKFVAEKYGLWAEFRMWPLGLLLAVLMAVFSRGSFVFAAPGATMIAPIKETKKGFVMKKVRIDAAGMGKIGLAGPIVNNILTLLFIGLFSFLPLHMFKIAAQINGWLAIFNLLPFMILDGQKVWHWSKWAWGGAMLLSVALFLMSGILI